MFGVPSTDLKPRTRMSLLVWSGDSAFVVLGPFENLLSPPQIHITGVVALMTSKRTLCILLSGLFNGSVLILDRGVIAGIFVVPDIIMNF